ncbi:KAP-like P-loop domain-containing protein [Chelatococcus asaccharovorans]|uniref:KAP-like P-loop domain-containing protein n=2 Tax=Chelatococcus asaccharovorans TaxID=28210 RepID=A0A2V3U3Y7_9HYPH|nr:KAP-like P-loop domain-containing protein [Chelatococcus asaccharovorans]
MTCEENDIWKDDLFDRKADATFLLGLLINRRHLSTYSRDSAFVLNVDADWGAGKTFFLKRFHQNLEKLKFLSCYINTWEDDFADDPLVPIISSIDKVIKPHIGRKLGVKNAWVKAKQAGATLAVDLFAATAKRAFSSITGAATEEIIDSARDRFNEGSTQMPTENNIRDAERATTNMVGKSIDAYAEKLVKSFEQKKKSVSVFRENIELTIDCVYKKTALDDRPLFVLIDELDRCRPDYAIRTLERIKHLFSVKNVVFVIATNNDQLRHSVCAVYGENFDSLHYLSRFFTSVYYFDEPELHDFVDGIFYRFSKTVKDSLYSPIDNASEFIATGCEYYRLSLRQCERLMLIIEVIAISRGRENPPIELGYLVPLVALFVLGSRLQDSDLVARAFQRKGQWEIPSRLGRINVAVLAEEISREIHAGIIGVEDSKSSGENIEWLKGAIGREQQFYARSGVSGNFHSAMHGYPALVRKAGRVTSGQNH